MCHQRSFNLDLEICYIQAHLLIFHSIFVQENEFAVFSPTQQRIRYLVEFSLPSDDNLDQKSRDKKQADDSSEDKVVTTIEPQNERPVKKRKMDNNDKIGENDLLVIISGY